MFSTLSKMKTTYLKSFNILQKVIAAPALVLLIILFNNHEIQAQQKKYDIAFSTCLNKDISKGGLKNKFVILDFWKTWCAPCIASFDETNELIEKYDSSEIAFANITDETDKLPRVKRILEVNPFNGYQLIDDNSRTFKRFKVKSFPTVFIIGKDGTLLWEGHPNELTETLILEKTGVKSNTNKSYKASASKKKDYKLRINNSESEIINTSMLQWNDEKTVIQYNSSSLHHIIANLKNTSTIRIISNKTNSDDFGIDIYGSFPKGQFQNNEIIDATILKALEEQYQYSIVPTTIKEEVWFLELVDEKKLLSWEANDGHRSSSISKKAVNYHGYTLKNTFTNFESKNKRIVNLDQMPTHISQKTFAMKLDKDMNKLQSNLKRRYGLKLSKKTMPVDKMKLVFHKSK